MFGFEIIKSACLIEGKKRMPWIHKIPAQMSKLEPFLVILQIFEFLAHSWGSTSLLKVDFKRHDIQNICIINSLIEKGTSRDDNASLKFAW